jgi:hypothetical protein
VLIAASHHHALHVYRTDAHLAAHAAEFARKGLARGEPTILVPNAAQRDPLLAQLAEGGTDVDRAMGEGRLVMADADALAAQATSSPAGLQEAWNGVVDLLSTVRGPSVGRVTVWRDAPHRLLRSGNRREFFELEARWCEITRDEGVSLLCSYSGDLLDDALYGGDLQDLFAHHTHLLGSEDADNLEAPVHDALCDVLGKRMAGMAWALADAAEPAIRDIHPSIARLVWLKQNMPSTWGRVIVLARSKSGRF